MEYGAPVTFKERETSIDILEESLNQIHRSRKAALTARVRQTTLRIERRKQHALRQGRVPKRREYDEEGDGQDIDQQLMEEFSAQFSAAPKPSAPPPEVKNNLSPSTKGGQGGGGKKKVGEQISPQLFRGTGAFDTTEGHHDDLAAASVFSDFRAELQAWWNDKKNLLHRQDEERRAAFSDYLTEKFMCKKLDPLPPSRVVTSVRKELSRIVEQFCSVGTLPDNFDSIIFEIGDTKQAEKIMRETGEVATAVKLKTLKQIDESNNLAAVESDTFNSDATGGDEEGYSRPKNNQAKKAIAMSAEEKKALERAKIKEQYESYMKLKSNIGADVDSKIAKQYEDLSSDINSLLSSIQSTDKMVAKNLKENKKALKN